MNNDITVNRKILQWGWYKNSNTKDVFLHLLLTANWHDGEYMGQKILRGQCVYGRRKFSEDLGISEQSIRTAINHLISTNEITIKSTNKFSVITIVKYSDYQLSSLLINQQDNQQSNIPPTNDQPTTNQQLTTSNLGNTSNTLKRIYNRAFAPPTIEEILAYCSERKNGIDAQRFFNFYQSKGWMIGKNKMKDWKAAVRTWEQKDGKKPNISTPDAYTDQKEDYIPEWMK